MYCYEKAFLSENERKMLSNYYYDYFDSHFKGEKQKYPRKLKKSIKKILDKRNLYYKLNPPPQYTIRSGSININQLK